jgi:uncharacterized membrane protein YfcA
MQFYWYIVLGVLLFIAGFVDAIAGGGGLISLPAYLIIGLPPHNALATNKLSSTCGTPVAVLRYVKSKKVILKCAVPAAAGALIGSPIGARLALVTSEQALKIILIAVLPVIAGIVIFKRNFGEKSRELKIAPIAYTAISLAIGLVLGLYDGFFGPGVGTFLVFAFTTILGQDLILATGNTKIVNLSSNVAALVTFLLSGTVWVGIGLFGAVFNVMGNWLGSGLALSKGPKIVKPVFVAVLALLLAKVIIGF